MTLTIYFTGVCVSWFLLPYLFSYYRKEIFGYNDDGFYLTVLMASFVWPVVVIMAVCLLLWVLVLSRSAKWLASLGTKHRDQRDSKKKNNVKR